MCGQGADRDITAVGAFSSAWADLAGGAGGGWTEGLQDAWATGKYSPQFGGVTWGMPEAGSP
eukprot:3934450-Rhodomonas_salina.2